MKVFIPAYFITSGHSVQKWKGTDMESMRDTKRIMEREIKKGSTPLTFEQMEIDTNNYQEITSVEKLTQVLSHCLLLDDVWIEDNLIGAKMYTIFKLGISSQSTAFLL